MNRDRAKQLLALFNRQYGTSFIRGGGTYNDAKSLPAPIRHGLILQKLRYGASVAVEAVDQFVGDNPTCQHLATLFNELSEDDGPLNVKQTLDKKSLSFVVLTLVEFILVKLFGWLVLIGWLAPVIWKDVIRNPVDRESRHPLMVRFMILGAIAGELQAIATSTGE